MAPGLVTGMSVRSGDAFLGSVYLFILRNYHDCCSQPRCQPYSIPGLTSLCTSSESTVTHTYKAAYWCPLGEDTLPRVRVLAQNLGLKTGLERHPLIEFGVPNFRQAKRHPRGALIRRALGYKRWHQCYSTTWEVR